MTSVEKLANSFRQWQKEWQMYDNNTSTSIKKPKSFNEFVAPFIEMHKQEILNAWDEGKFEGRFNGEKKSEQYYKETFKK